MTGDTTPARVRVRPATAADCPSLPAIERAASRLFLDAGVPSHLVEDVTPVDEFTVAARDGRLWVASLADDVVVGFALVAWVDGGPHLEEIDVDPAVGRRGIGATLVRAVIEWARVGGHRWLTLTTFADLPWNAPFYARLGFRPLASDAVGPELRAVLAEEARRGFPPERRVAMRLALRPGASGPG